MKLGLRVCASLGAVLLIGCSKVVDPDPPAPLPLLESELPIKTLWRTQIGVGADEQRVALVPAYDGENFYVADRKGRVVSVRLTDGRRIWEKDTELPITGGVGFVSGTLLIGTQDGEVVALDAGNGDEMWRSRVSSEVLAPPQGSEAGVVVVQTVDDKVFALGALNGTQRWFYQQRAPTLTLRGTSTPLIDGGVVYVGFASGRMVALDLANGRVIWENIVAAPRGSTELDRLVDIDASPLRIGDTLYVTSYQGRLAAITSGTGVLLWARDISSHQAVDRQSDRLFITDANGHIWSVSSENGSAIWKQEKLQARGLTAPVSYGDFVVAGDFEGYLHFLSRSDGRIRGRIQIDSEGYLQSPMLIDGVLYSYGKGGVLAALRIADES